jgi:phage shock protein C
MYCNQCGNAIEEHFRYCSRCGAATENTPPRSEPPRNIHSLTRPREGKRIAGVCAGVARYLDLDVTLVRVVWVLLVIFPPVPGILVYIICWIVMPQDPAPLPHQIAPVGGSPQSV